MTQIPVMSNAQSTGIGSIANIDVLRAFAIIGVFFNHVFAMTGYNFPILGKFGGLFGVQLFFLISGYLITESAIKHSTREYVVHRFFRIFPTYWLVYIVFLVLQGGYVDKQIIWSSVVLNLLNLQQISPSALIRYDVIHVSWTLTIELFWYALAPLVVLGGKRLALPALLLFGLISTSWSVLAARGSLDWIFANGFSALPSPADFGQQYIVKNAAFPAQLAFFIIGSNIYYFRDQVLRWSSTLLNLLLVGFLCCVEIYVDRVPGPTLLTGIGVFALFIIVIRATPSKDWFLIRIGKVSYSFYLTHFSILMWVTRTFPTYPKLLVVLLGFAATFILSNLLFEYVEKPFMRIGRNLSRKFAKKSKSNAVTLPGASAVEGSSCSGSVT